MDALHPEATPIYEDPSSKSLNNKQIGWRYQCEEFTFDAIENEDSTISIYVVWDDDNNDLASASSFAEASRFLQEFIKVSEK